LEDKREDLQSRMRQIRSGAEEAWDEIAAGLDLAIEDVQHALHRAGEKWEKVA
jgi:hypothetical protein